jgi:PAS domain S-box-containing protein
MGTARQSSLSRTWRSRILIPAPALTMLSALVAGFRLTTGNRVAGSMSHVLDLLGSHGPVQLQFVWDAILGLFAVTVCLLWLLDAFTASGKRSKTTTTRLFAQSMIEHSPAAVIATDLNFTICVINRAAQKMLGYRGEDVIGCATPLLFFDLEQVDDRASQLAAECGAVVSRERAIFAASCAGGEERREWTFVRRDGSRLFVEVTAVPLQGEDAELVGYLITANDISERRQRENTAAAARSKIEAIDRSQMIIEFDMQGTILTANENYLRLFGYEREELVGKGHDIFFTEEDGAGYQQLWEGLRAGKFQDGEFRRVSKQGREVWIGGHLQFHPRPQWDSSPSDEVRYRHYGACQDSRRNQRGGGAVAGHPG